MKQPQNETETHFMLKEIAKYILWGWGYSRLGTEVGNMYSLDDIGRNPKRDMKHIIDAVGIRKIGKFIKGVGTQYYYDVKGIEAKASLSDFKNGFCAAPAYTYIIAPKGIIPVELIPDKIGFIEVVFEEFSIKRGSNKIEDMTGVYLTLRAKNRIDGRFANETQYREWCRDILENIAYRCSQELLFWRNVIEFTK
jgi:hypothetical protein